MGVRKKVGGIIRRGTAGLVIAFAVFATAFFCAWRGYGNFSNYRASEHATRQYLTQLTEEIERHRAAKGRLPDSLAELEVVRKGETRLDDAGQAADAWGNPYRYRVEGDNYSLYSFGRDGRPGGVGLDADVYPWEVGQTLQPPTLWQFAFEMQTGGIVASCALAGILAGLVWFQTLEEPTDVGRSWTRFLTAVGAMAVTLVVSVFAALFISAVHLPSGH
jgi:type II secretory pathway pseudopilin PulG